MLGQVPSWMSILGAILITAGVILAQWDKREAS
jgi:drug/metabolite transporter (DMT)-like permease